MKSPIAIVGLGKAGGSLVASARAARVSVVGKASRLAPLMKNNRWLAARVLILAVPDDVIEECAEALAACKKKLPAIVVHMAGARGPSVLATALAGRSTVGAFHPLASLDGRTAIPKGTLVAVDATTRGAINELSALAKRFGCKPAHVPEEQRARYHAGAVIAGNLPVALLRIGIQLLFEAGVPDDVARVSLARLLESQAINAEKQPLARALTGPVARGDAATLRKHLAILKGEDAELYRMLSRILIDVRLHGEAKTKALRDALDEPKDD